MMRRRLLWQLFPSFLVIILVSLLAVTAYCTRALRRFYIDQTANVLLARANLVESFAASMLDRPSWGDLDRLCKELSTRCQTRITVILPNGQVVADSEKDPKLMDNHSKRPEVMDAMETGYGQNLRFSDTLKKELMYVAVPIRKGDSGLAIVRCSVAMTAIGQTLKDIYMQMMLAGLVIALGAAIVTWMMSRRISHPAERMKQLAMEYAQGRFEHSIPTPDSAELASLAESLNEMARQLDERLRTVTQQRNQLEAVLSSMAEGVLAVDHLGRMMSINRAAAGLLNIEPDKVKGEPIQNVVRQPQIQNFVEKAMEATTIEDNIVLSGGEDRYFRLHGTGLTTDQGQRAGAVIVMTDMTKLQQLENMRRDFVANVSHELKTPVTTVKGFVETLLDGAIDQPDQARRFLEIIAKQSNRLNAIIEDLLSLSHIEQDCEKNRIEFEELALRPVLASAIDLARIYSDKKQIQIELDCDTAITTCMNGALLEQAVLNLLTNAVKYSPEAGRIDVVAEDADNGVNIRVRDHGCGIDARHLDRIFERFYVADKARSRKLGGTGLGLAIVKHIAQAHGGTVSVESTPGKGSTFTVLLPVR